MHTAYMNGPFLLTGIEVRSMGNKLLNVKEVAELLNIKPGTAYLWACRKGMPSMKVCGIRRFDPDEVMAWVRKQDVSERTA
jgi:excisionase family DNA binding protein